MDMYARLKTTAQEFLDSYDRAVDNKDTKHLNDALTADCRRTFDPMSLVQLAPSLAAGRSNEEFAQQEAPFFAQFATATTTQKDMTIDEKQKKIVLQLHFHCVTLDGSVFDLENMTTLYTTEDGTKIKKIHQFVDSLTGKALLDLAGAIASVEGATSGKA